METPGADSQISPQEAAASLGTVEDSQRRARRVGYPVWLWLATGLGLAAVPLWIGKAWLPTPWESVLSLASLVLLAATAITASLCALRGMHGSQPTLARGLQEVSLFLWPVVAYVAIVVAGGIAWVDGFWHAPLAPLTTAAAAFVAWVGLGLAATTFSARR
ncbi:MAG: hypothetical protein ACRDQA_18865 [Nocardioidaceae bacterium]